eukprot:626615_1
MSTLKRARRNDSTESDPPPPKRHKSSNSNPSNTESLSLQRRALPIDECKDEILSIINNPDNDIVIITGDTGSGKSTQLSQILYHSNLFQSIIITQPRRIGAVSLARRVSKEMNTALGQTVGYTIRFQDYSSTHTSIRYVTDGILLRELTTNQNDHHVLQKYDCIILDEAHERSLQTDILFSILRGLIQQNRNNKHHKLFKLLITSATLNVDKFSSFFMNAPVYHIPGRCFPVEIFHCTQQQRNYVDACVDTALRIHCTETDVSTEGELGHILCFLTGQQEIDRACALMGQKIDEVMSDHHNDAEQDEIPDCVILAAYGSMSYDKQQQIFAKVPANCRKIIFATNIAETSLTVDGICYVIDPGLVKQKQFNYDQGIEELIINNISKISAIQRKGRCGRTRNGKCYRLYTKQELNEFEEETIPEILRNDLCSTILTLKTIGIGDIAHFEYLDKPELPAFVNALNKLYLLDAIDKRGNLNRDIGVTMSRLPLDPMYSKILIESQNYKCVDIALSLVSIISANSGTSSDLFLRPAASLKEEEKGRYYEAHKQFDSKYGDIISWLLLFNHYMRVSDERADNEHGVYRWTQTHFVNGRILKNALKIRNQLQEIVRKEFDEDVWDKQSMKPIKSIRKVLAKSLFMQTATMVDHSNKNSYKYKENKEQNKRNVVFRLCRNAEYELNVFIHPSSVSSLMSSSSMDFKWVVYLDILYTSKPFMRGICGIKYEWIKTLLPKMGHRIQWFEPEEKERTNDTEDLSIKSTMNETKQTTNVQESNRIEKNEKKKPANIDSVKERYLRRKMLKNKLKSL